VRSGSKVGFIAITAISGVLLAVPGLAQASGRPCGPGVSMDGKGTLGSPYTLKSKHDDDGPNGTQVVGEEFEIGTPAGRVWHVTFADNGVVFFDADQTATVDGLRSQAAAPNQPGTQHMTVHAVDRTTGEVIDGAVDVPPAPNCGR
jgi:hypothetical protein